MTFANKRESKRERDVTRPATLFFVVVHGFICAAVFVFVRASERARKSADAAEIGGQSSLVLLGGPHAAGAAALSLSPAGGPAPSTIPQRAGRSPPRVPTAAPPPATPTPRRRHQTAASRTSASLRSRPSSRHIGPELLRRSSTKFSLRSYMAKTRGDVGRLLFRQAIVGRDKAVFFLGVLQASKGGQVDEGHRWAGQEGLLPADGAAPRRRPSPAAAPRSSRAPPPPWPC